jgi:hypothetical protein
MKPASYAPVYCALYPELAELTRRFGYALAIHGSMAKDFDIVAIPWTPNAADPNDVVAAICTEFAFINGRPDSPVTTEHGRVSHPLMPLHSHGCYLDISFMPRIVGGK